LGARQEMVANLQAQTNLLIGMIMPKLHNQLLQWKCRALKVIVEDAKLAKYDFFPRTYPPEVGNIGLAIDNKKKEC